MRHRPLLDSVSISMPIKVRIFWVTNMNISRCLGRGNDRWLRTQMLRVVMYLSQAKLHNANCMELKPLQLRLVKTVLPTAAARITVLSAAFLKDVNCVHCVQKCSWPVSAATFVQCSRLKSARGSALPTGQGRRTLHRLAWADYIRLTMGERKREKKPTGLLQNNASQRSTNRMWACDRGSHDVAITKENTSGYVQYLAQIIAPLELSHIV